MNQTATQKSTKTPKAPPALVEIAIDVPAHCTLKDDPRGGIILDGTIYAHGEKYQVTPGVYAMLADIMQKAWDHDAQIHGQTNENSYRRHKAPRVRGF